MLVVLPHATFSLSEMLHLEFERKPEELGIAIEKRFLETGHPASPGQLRSPWTE
jgi:hypothetical protein